MLMLTRFSLELFPTRRTLLTGAAALLLGSACSDVLGIGCGDVAEPGIWLSVTPARADKPFTAPPEVTVTSGSYSERAVVASVAPQGGYFFAAASDRPGTYAVHVSAPGFRDWTRTNVEVRSSSSCRRVNTVELAATLEPTVP
jgi:hypothetical protein